MARLREEEQSLTFSLDMGVDNTSVPQLVQPTGPAAALVASQNTRLTKTRGTVSKAPGTVAVSGGTTAVDVPCLGLVPHGLDESTVAFHHPATGSKRLVGGVAAALKGTGILSPGTTSRVNSYVPAKVSRAGVLPGGNSWQTAAVAYDEVNDCTWTASIRVYNTTTCALYVSCMRSTGELLVQPYPLVTSAGTSPLTEFPFVALTSHGQSGVVLWYATQDTGNTIYASTLSVSSLVLTAGTATAIYTPVTLAACQASVASDGLQYAYLATIHSATNTTVCTHKIDVTTFGVTTYPKAAFCILNDKLDIAVLSNQGSWHVLVAVASHASGTNLTLYNGSNMSNTWTQTGLIAAVPADEVTAGFHVTPSATYAMVAITDVQGSIAAPANATTWLEFRAISTGASVWGHRSPWIRPIGKAAHLKVASDEVYPLLAIQRWYANVSFGTEGYVTDPSIEIIRPDGLYASTTLGRFGVDTAYRPGVSSGFSLNTSYCYGTKYFLSHLEDVNSHGFDGYPQRYVELDFSAHQPRYAHTADGVALIAGALPAQWDGQTVTEVNPMHRPMIHVYTAGGSGPVLTTGAYRVACVHAWKDASGELHRSMPSEVRTISGAGMQPRLYSVRPLTTRDGASNEEYDTIWYMSDVDGTVLYHQDPDTRSTTGWFDTWDYVAQPVIGADNPPIYSDGDASQPLMSQCLPATLDVALVGNRAWWISAEKPNELWPSKEKEPHIAYEYSSDLIVRLPSYAGLAKAVVELNGIPIVLTSTGVYAITGQGPDATLQGSFNPAQKLSDQRCTETASVISCPAGVLYRSGNRFAIFAGQSRVFPEVDASLMGDCVATILLRDTQEVLLVGTLLHYVYNYAVDKWTTWTLAAIPSSTCAALVPPTGDIVTYSVAVGQHYLADVDAASTIAQITVTTGDILFGGPQDDAIVSDVIVHGRYAGAHGLSVTLAPDYGQSSAVTKTFTAADILAATVAGQYSLACSAGTLSCRALKVSITETGAAGEGFQPTSVTILVTKNPGTKRDAIRAAGRK